MTEKNQLNVRLISILAVSCLLLAMLPGSAYSQNVAAIVRGVEGEANVYTNGYKDIVKLSDGSTIQPLAMVNTSAKSKVLLRWNGGLFTSLGESSSLSSVTEKTNGPVSQIQLVEGIARFKTDPAAANPVSYTVATPLATIRPASDGEPLDYVIEVYEPNATILTVLSGKVGVVDTTSGSSQETVYSSCQTVYFTQNNKPQVRPVSTDAIAKLADHTTIASTLALPETCPVAMAPEPAPRVEMAPSISEYEPDYYLDDSYVDFYPYGDVTVSPYYDGGYWCRLWDIGNWFIPYNYWVSPAIVQVYVNQYLINRAIFINRTYLDRLARGDLALRQVIATATRTGNLALAGRARNELMTVQTRQTWAQTQLASLQRRQTNLHTAASRFSNQLPGGGSTLANSLANSFTSSRNASVAKGFVNRLQNQTNLENRLTTVAQKQANTLSGRLASVRDPAQRLAGRTQLAAMTQNLTQGKIPFTANNSRIGKIARTLGSTQDPAKRQAIQGQMLSAFKQTGPSGTEPGALSSQALAALGRSVNNFPNAGVRRDLSTQVSGIQKAAKSMRTQPNLLSSLGPWHGIAGSAGPRTNLGNQSRLQQQWKTQNALRSRGFGTLQPQNQGVSKPSFKSRARTMPKPQQFGRTFQPSQQLKSFRPQQFGNVRSFPNRTFRSQVAPRSFTPQRNFSTPRFQQPHFSVRQPHMAFAPRGGGASAPHIGRSSPPHISGFSAPRAGGLSVPQSGGGNVRKR